MNLLENPLSLALGIALLAAVTGLRRFVSAQRTLHGARELIDELRAPQIALGIYLAAWLWMFLHRAGTDAQSARVALVAVHACGGVALLRILDVSFFAALRATRHVPPPRIVRSLAIWILSSAIIVVAARSAWQIDLGSLLTTSALLSVVLGFALQESLGNLFAGLTLNAEHPFEAGDWITFGSREGRVVDVGWRSTRLMTIDEDELLVPNGLISREVVVNHSRPSARRVVELQFTLDFEASPTDVKRVLLSTSAAVEGVLKVPAPTAQLVRFVDDGVLWKLRVAIADFAANDDVRDRVQQALWYALRRAAIHVPTRQLSVSRRERPAEAEARRVREHLAEAEELLGRIDFVAALNPEARAELAGHAHYFEYGPGEAVVREGEKGDSFYLVASGHLGVHVAGKEAAVAQLVRGDFFGEVSLLTDEPRTATVVAIDAAALLVVNRDAFARLFAADEGVMEQLARVIAGRKAQLASAREGGKESSAPETQTMLARIRGIFGRRR